MNRRSSIAVSLASIVVSAVVFLVPFAFIAMTAVKSPDEARALDFSWPSEWPIVENFQAVIEARNYMVVAAFINSTILTVSSVALLVLFGAIVAYVLQRRESRLNGLVGFLVLAGLIIPPAVVPTIWVLQEIHLFKTLSGMIMIEVAYGLPFTVLLFRAFVATIPRELDEAAIIDGAGPLRLFFTVIFPMLRSVMITVIVVQSVVIFNDFAGPLYFLPGDDAATVQLTLYNFQGQYNTQYNLLFMNILLITIPPLVMFVFFNKRIVAGLTAGAIKG